MNKNRNILVGITGSIAVVLLFNLVEELEKNGFNVRVVATKASWLFVLSVFLRKPGKIFKFLKIWESGLLEITSVFSKKRKQVRHINLVKWADAILIAPASANTISKVSLAIADNFLTTISLAMPSNKKIFIAPAMNNNMWLNPLFQENVKRLEKEPMYTIIGPVVGELKCGDEGIGRMVDVATIVKTLKERLE